MKMSKLERLPWASMFYSTIEAPGCMSRRDASMLKILLPLYLYELFTPPSLS